MEIAPMTKRDKILLYVVLMLAFVVLFVRFLLIPGLRTTSRPTPICARRRTPRPPCRMRSCWPHLRRREKQQLGRTADRQRQLLQPAEQ